MHLEWGKCKGDVWCSFWRLILDGDLNAWYGVYIIWEESVTGERMVRYVGEGTIGKRIAYHRNDEKFKNRVGTNAYVTWARVGSKWQGLAIEAYLARHLNPSLGLIERFRKHIEVNLPWEY